MSIVSDVIEWDRSDADWLFAEKHNRQILTDVKRDQIFSIKKTTTSETSREGKGICVEYELEFDDVDDVYRSFLLLFPRHSDVPNVDNV